MRRSFALRVVVLLGASTVLLFALTVYLGSGSRADNRCLGSFFVSGGEWSWSHLATRCEYGEPSRAGYVHSWAFFLLVGTAGATLFQGYNALADRRGWRRI